MDVCAKALKVAAKMIEDGGLETALQARYAKWDFRSARILKSDLDTLSTHVMQNDINPTPVSGKQELLENYVNRFL